RHEEADDEGDGETRVADVSPERHVVRAAGLQDEHDDEHDGHERSRDEPEVRALLREQLRELPAVDPGDAAHEATAVRSWSLDSPPVSERNSSSSDSRSGTSAVIPMRACPSATESPATASSSALKRSAPSDAATFSTPVCVRQTFRARSGSPVRSRYVVVVAAISSRSEPW